MGFTKKETIVAQKKEPTPLPQKKVVTIMKTLVEKNECKYFDALEYRFSRIAHHQSSAFFNQSMNYLFVFIYYLLIFIILKQAYRILLYD